MTALIDSMSDQDPDMSLGRQVRQLNASNLAEHERLLRLDSAGFSSPSTNSRPRTSPAALRSRSGTVQGLEDAPTVIMDDRAVTV